MIARNLLAISLVVGQGALCTRSVHARQDRSRIQEWARFERAALEGEGQDRKLEMRVGAITKGCKRGSSSTRYTYKNSRTECLYCLLQFFRNETRRRGNRPSSLGRELGAPARHRWPSAASSVGQPAAGPCPFPFVRPQRGSCPDDSDIPPMQEPS